MSSQDPFAEIHALLRQGKHTEVLAQILDAGANEILEPFRQDLNHAWYVVGDIYYRAGKYVPAIDAFERSLTDRPDDLEAILALGNACSEVHDYERAENVLRRGRALEPGNDAVLYNLGNSLFDQGEYKEAIDAYQQVSTADESVFEKARRNLLTAQERLDADDA